MLQFRFAGKNLIKSTIAAIDDAFAGPENLEPLGKLRAFFNHLFRCLVNKSSLLSISGCAIDFRLSLSIGTKHIERHCRSELGLSVFFGDLDVDKTDLPITIGPDSSECRADHFFPLPWEELK